MRSWFWKYCGGSRKTSFGLEDMWVIVVLERKLIELKFSFHMGVGCSESKSECEYVHVILLHLITDVFMTHILVSFLQIPIISAQVLSKANLLDTIPLIQNLLTDIL
jgi:hypothetical protein